MREQSDILPGPTDLKYLQDTLYAVSGKWKLPILYSLGQGKMKFRELQRTIPGITSRMLTKELRDLELHGFIERKLLHPFSTIADYEVTAYCKSFEKIITEMIQWGKKHRAVIASTSL